VSEPGLPEPPALLSIVSGANQSAFMHTQLPQPIVAQLLNSRGRPVKGQVVNFRVVQGGGSVWAGASTTDSNGMVKDWWTLGDFGPNLLEARTVDSQAGEKLVLGTVQATALFLDEPTAQCRIAPDVTWEVDQPGECGASVDFAPRVRFGTSVQMEILVTNDQGTSVPGLLLNFAKDGGGSVQPLHATTNASGIASVTLTMGTTIPNNSLFVYNQAAGLGQNFAFLGVP
jgi:hypothetical protein